MKLGRVESALGRDLKTDDSIGPSERAALRVCARALDRAEAMTTDEALSLVAQLSRIYLDLRMAAGLSRNSPAKAANDPFDQLAAALAGPVIRDPA